MTGDSYDASAVATQDDMSDAQVALIHDAGQSAGVELAHGLAKHLGRVWGTADVRVTGLERLTGGSSRQTWRFMVTTPDVASRTLVLRLDPQTEPRPEFVAIESIAIKAAEEAGVPVPGVVTWSAESDELGAPFLIMEYIEGETIPRRILRSPELAATRTTLAAECGRLLGRIHGIPATAVQGVPRSNPLEELWEVYNSYDELHPAMELAFRWLEDNKPDPSPPTLVHGEFRNGNLIIGIDGIRAVLDWEHVHIGDPVQDLGWVCLRAWRFGAPEPVGGFGSYEQLITAYEDERGVPLNMKSLLWWEVFGTLRWGVMCIRQAERHLSGAVRSVDLAALGRRVCEQEYDLLRLLRRGSDEGGHHAA